MSGDRHQRATAHPAVEAASLDRALFSDLKALAGHRGLSGAQRRCVLRPSDLTPHGVLSVVVHLTGGMQRAADGGRDPFQSQKLSEKVRAAGAEYVPS